MKYFLLLISIALVSFAPHKFYVSNALIEQRVQTQSFQITIKIFTDDLERALGGESLHLGEENEATTANGLIEEYLRNHFKIWYNDQVQLLTYIGKEAELDMTICYFEMHQANDFNVLKVEDNLLIELFPEQKNIVELRSGGRTQTVILTKDKTTETIFH